MARKVFFSFHFDKDFWRTQQVRNINALEGNSVTTANDWETVKKDGDKAVKNWIDEQMKGRSCAIVLVGNETADRKWVRYEIEKAWNDGRGVLGIRIHQLLDQNGNNSVSGANPFDGFTLSNGTKKLSSVAPLKNPAGIDSKGVYASISNNIETWIEEAVKARKDFKA